MKQASLNDINMVIIGEELIREKSVSFNDALIQWTK